MAQTGRSEKRTSPPLALHTCIPGLLRAAQYHLSEPPAAHLTLTISASVRFPRFMFFSSGSSDFDRVSTSCPLPGVSNPCIRQLEGNRRPSFARMH